MPQDNDITGSNSGEAWRQQVIDARREQILTAAADVFADKGYHRATIRDIARRAGIADGTIYNYFESKRDLFMGLVDKLAFAGLNEMLSDVGATNPAAILRALLRNRLQFVTDNRSILISVFPEVISDPELRTSLFGTQIPTFMARVGEFLRQGSASGILVDIEPKVVIQVVMGTLITYSLLAASPDVQLMGDIPEEELLDQWAKLLYYGLATRPEAS